jgi:phosphohistidine phosphatase
VKLLLFRHGPAGDRLAWRASGRPDAVRPLTADGRARTRAAVRGLSRALDPPGAVATSPLVRAVETAAILCRGLGAGAAEELPALEPPAPPDAVLPWLHAHRRTGLAALVGHEPHLSRLACWLLAGEAGAGGEPFLGLRKAGACLLDLGTRPGPGRARLLWLLAPAQLRRLGR